MAKKTNNQFKSVDKISKDLDIVDNFVLRNWKKYTYVAVGIVIIVAAGLFFYESKSSNNINESQEILTAKTVPELQDVIKKYPNSKSVDFSRLNLAADYFNSKDFDKAVETYNDEINNGTDSTAVELAKMNLNYALNAKGDNENATAGFMKIADDQSFPEFIRAESAYSAGSILITMNKKEEALKYLNLCVSFKDSKGWNKFAKGLIDSIS